MWIRGTRRQLRLEERLQFVIRLFAGMAVAAHGEGASGGLSMDAGGGGSQSSLQGFSPSSL